MAPAMLPLAALLLACVPAAAPTQEITGEAIARLYMAMPDLPQGWALSYKGMDGDTVVFVMDRDLDTFPLSGSPNPSTPSGQ